MSMQKYTREQLQQFQRQIDEIDLGDSESELEDSFYEKEIALAKKQLADVRNSSKNGQILKEVRQNLEREKQMIDVFENDVTELQMITKDEAKNVIAKEQISEIKAKVADNNNKSHLLLADEQYKVSVLQQSQVDNEPTIDNKSFIKKKTAAEESRKEEESIRVKIEATNREREQLQMECEDKLSMKHEIERMSLLFKDRFSRPIFPRRGQKDCKIQLKEGKAKSTFTNLAPQPVNDDTVLPRNAPEIALKALKAQGRRRKVKTTSVVEVKVKSARLREDPEKFEEVKGEADHSATPRSELEVTLTDYIRSINSCIDSAETISQNYHPKFVKFLGESEKNLNYDYESQAEGGKSLSQVASLDNASQLKELKMSSQQLTSLQGIESFHNVEEGALQFNRLVKVDGLRACSRLIQLNLSYNRIRDVTALTQLEWLRVLSVEHNQITTLDLACPSLEILSASYNRVQELSLSQAKFLRVLLLGHNKINELAPLKLYHLQELDLSHNYLKTADNLNDLILLKKLNLRQNRLTTLPQPFIYLYLNELTISHNMITSLPTLLLPCLERLYLDHNRIANRSAQPAYLPNLRQFNLNNNSLQGFAPIWHLLRYSRRLQFITYADNEYFLALREKVRQIYEYIIYKYMGNLKIINESQNDIGIRKYLEENYGIYYDGVQLFEKSPDKMVRVENRMRAVLEEFRLAGRVEEIGSKFREQREYSLYQSSSKVARLREIVGEMEEKTHNKRATVVGQTLFYHHDLYQQRMRTLYHRLRGSLIRKTYKRALRSKYFMKKKPEISEGMFFLKMLYDEFELKKVVAKFATALKGINETQAAIKIQKCWRGFVRRRLFLKLMGRYRQKAESEDSDFEDVDIDFFDQKIEREEFDIEGMEGFDMEDVIIRPEVFDMLRQRQEVESKASEKIKEEVRREAQGQSQQGQGQGGPMRNNFVGGNESGVSQRDKGPTQEQQLMKEWRISDPRLLKTLQYKQQKRMAARKKEEDKLMSAAERLERFRRGGK